MFSKTKSFIYTYLPDKQSFQKMIKTGGAAFFLRLLGAALNFGFNVLLARFLGSEGAGIYYIAYTVVLFSSLIGRLGLERAMLRYASIYASQKKWISVAGIYRRGMLISVGMSVLMTFIVVINAEFISTVVFKEPNLLIPLQLMAISIIPFNLNILHAEMLKSFGQIVKSTLLEAAGIPFILMLIFIVNRTSMGASSVTLAYSLSTLIIFITGVFLWRQATPQLRHIEGFFKLSILITTALPLFWINFLNTSMTHIDTFLLGVWLNSESVGIYGVARRISVLVSFILIVINSIVAPKFAALYSEGKLEELNNLVRQSSILNTVLSAPFLLILIFVPNKVLLIFGEEFSAGGLVLSILALGQFVNAASGSVGYLLVMTGHEKLMRNNVFAATALNLLLIIILVPRFDIVGAAIATASSLVVWNIIGVSLVYWKLKIMTLPIPMIRKAHD